MRKGICKNVGLCNNANSHKTIIINDDNEEFVCPDCGEPLEPVNEEEENKPSNGNNRTLLIGIVAAVVIIGGILFAVFSGGDESTPATKEAPVATVDSDSIAKANADAELQKEKARADSLAKVAEDAQAKSQQAAPVAQPTTKTAAKPTSNRKAEAPKPQAKASSNGKLRLSYGTYSGDMKDGYPDGMGRLTYTSSRQINRYDSKKRMASPGDYVIGEFVRGFFVHGKHFDSDGNLIETLIIGASVGSNYESK